MTAYKNFIKDFPSRCRDILDIAKRPALCRGREVTLALMVASAGLVVPYERLKPDSRWDDHPSGDRKKFADAAEKLKSLLCQPFMSSPLWPATSSIWRAGELDSVTGEPDSWDGLQKSRLISKNKKVSTILKIIRNALAHGNIWTCGNPIKAIIFVRSVNDGPSPKFDCLLVTPDQFHHFLEKWFDFLTELSLPQEVMFEILKDAA